MHVGPPLMWPDSPLFPTRGLQAAKVGDHWSKRYGFTIEDTKQQWETRCLLLMQRKISLWELLVRSFMSLSLPWSQLILNWNVAQSHLFDNRKRSQVLILMIAKILHREGTTSHLYTDCHDANSIFHCNTCTVNKTEVSRSQHWLRTKNNSIRHVCPIFWFAWASLCEEELSWGTYKIYS